MSKDIDNEPVSYRYTFLLLNLINVAHRCLMPTYWTRSVSTGGMGWMRR